MAKAIVVYGSTSGNTEKLSEAVAAGLKTEALEVVRMNVADSTSEVLKDYEVIVLGCSTWGDGELQDDFIRFEADMKKLNLVGKKGAVFGPGDSMYPQFCQAVYVLADTLKAAGAEIDTELLKIDGDIDEAALEKTQAWGAKVGETALNMK